MLPSARTFTSPRWVPCALLALCAALAGCDAFDEDDPSATSPAGCTSAAQCPDGQACVQGRCVIPGPGADPGPPSEPPATGSTPESTDRTLCRRDCALAQECEPAQFGATYTSVGACTDQCERDIASARNDLDAACFAAQLDRLACVGRIDSCEALSAYSAGTPGAACVAELHAALIACDPLSAACADDCMQRSTCEPEDFDNRFGDEEACMAACLDQLARDALDMTPQCFAGSGGLLMCTSTLTCDALSAFLAAEGDYPCRAAWLDADDACFEQYVCELDCDQFATCDPAGYAATYDDRVVCVDLCADDVEAARLVNSRACHDADMLLFECVSQLDCAARERYFDPSESNPPCAAEAAQAAACD